jgi:ankyrin repeat protein
MVTDPSQLKLCFKKNAEKSWSIPIATILLSRGVDINTRGLDGSGFTPLYSASGNESLKAAEFMKFLLRSGADPDVEIARKPAIRERPGPRNISRWFGVSWDEFVRESRKVADA